MFSFGASGEQGASRLQLIVQSGNSDQGLDHLGCFEAHQGCLLSLHPTPLLPYNQFHRRYDFLAREAEVVELEKLTLRDVRDWWAAHLAAGSCKRRKLAVHVSPTKACPAAVAAAAVDSSAGGSTTPKAKRAKRGTAAKGGKAASKQEDVVVVTTVEDWAAFKATCKQLPHPPPQAVPLACDE